MGSFWLWSYFLSNDFKSKLKEGKSKISSQMGSVGFLRFFLLCFDFLAWPTFALGYPLWASIRAIEAKASKSRMQKLVIYWTIFSLISLFEIFFVKLVQWVPLWPYIKLVTVCWLVIPQFNGACHVYRCLIHPCLSVNPQDIINWFCISKEKPFSEESFLALAEAYLKENGPEALEKLITSKAKGKEHILTDADALQVVKKVEPTKKNVTTEEKLAKGKEHMLTDADALQVVKRVESTEKNVTAEEQLAKGKEHILTDADALQVVKRVEPIEKNVTAEVQLAKGKEHILTDADALQVVKRVEPAEKNVTAEQLGKGKEHILTDADALQVVKRVEPTEKNVTAEEQLAKGKEHILTDADALHVVKRVEPAEKNVKAEEQLVKHPKPLLVDSDKEEIASSEAQRVTAPEESQEKRPSEIHALKKVQREWTCAMCQVTTTSEAILNSHLLGRKHRSKCEKLKTSTQAAKNMQSSAAKQKVKSEELKTCIQRGKKLKSAAVETNEVEVCTCGMCLPGEGSKQSTTEKAKSTHISAASGQRMQ